MEQVKFNVELLENSRKRNREDPNWQMLTAEEGEYMETTAPAPVPNAVNG